MRELETLPGIGPALAKRIVEFRDKRHGFKRVEELLGEALPPSALEYEQWWRGGRVKRGRIDANWQDQVQQRAWEDVGWTVEDLDLFLKNVTFRRK